MKIKYCLILFLVIPFSIIQATPDRQRYIIDNLIGLNGNNIIIHQFVFDNLQSHYDYILEEYLIEKYMENGKTIIIKNIKITEKNSIENILINEYNGNIIRIIPDINFFFYNIQSIINNEYIEITGEINRRFYLRDYIPKELINYVIIRVVDIYFINEYIYLKIDLRDNTNNYRKIIMIQSKDS
jgi:hypothetical protein